VISLFRCRHSPPPPLPPPQRAPVCRAARGLDRAARADVPRTVRSRRRTRAADNGYAEASSSIQIQYKRARARARTHAHTHTRTHARHTRTHTHTHAHTRTHTHCSCRRTSAVFIINVVYNTVRRYAHAHSREPEITSSDKHTSSTHRGLSERIYVVSITGMQNARVSRRV